jgi:hypothetical protein
MQKGFNRSSLAALLLAFTLVACGGGGTPSTDTNGDDTPDPDPDPIAIDAGADQSVEEGGEVTLTATLTNGTGSTSVTWTQTAGDTVTLSDAASLTTSFTAPEVDSDTTLTFQVAVDGDSSVSDSVTITVKDSDNTPSAIDSLGLTDIALRDPDAVLVADFYTPAVMSDRLAESRSISWSPLDTAAANLTRFAFGEADTDDVFVVTETGNSVGTSLAASSGLVDLGVAQNDVLLRSIFQFVEVADGEYAVFSAKHGNYALDVGDDDVSLVLRDARGVTAYEAGTASFLTFSLSGSVSGTPTVLTAINRYVIDVAESAANDTLAYDAVDGWTSMEVVAEGGALELTDSAGTAMNLYAAPVNLDIPGDFNPDSVTRVSNLEYYDPAAAEDDQFANGIAGIADKYAAQVAAPGGDGGTLAAAEAMLDEIESALASQDTQLRYPREFYLILRAGLLNVPQEAGEVTDTVLGTRTVPYVYFTNEMDSLGDYHPFMVVATRGVPDSLALLRDVPRPPGDGLGGGYENENVTRSFYLENFLLRIPMRDYGEVSDVAENDLRDIGSLADDVGEVNYDHHNYASTGQSAVAVDGVVIYPSYNNTLTFAQEAGELSARGMHSGRGLGVHYHADPHAAAVASATADTGFNLYNTEDYAGVHPPIISVGFDGVAGYGPYLAGDSESDGTTVSLDGFGGHEHDDYGYHYHAFSTDRQSRNLNDYETHVLGPLGAWAGRINYVPDFQDGSKRSIWLGNENN